MARPLRIEFPGAVYHVTARGDRREEIYRDDTDRRTHLAVLGAAMKRFNAELLAYCLMGNHFHLVLHTRRANLSRAMQYVNGIYTQRFNKRHALVGHLFQGRFKAILVDRDAYLVALCRYVERNPVAAKLVKRPQDWLWSSCRAHLGLTVCPPWLDTIGLHGHLLGRPVRTPQDQQRAATLYAELIAQCTDADLWRRGLRQETFLGDEAFVSRTLRELAILDREREDIPKRVLHGKRDLSTILAGYADRSEGMRAAHIEGGITMTEIARHFGLSVSRVSRVIAALEAKGKA